MLVTLKDMLSRAVKKDYAIAGFNVFGYEDAISVVNVAERLNTPVILMTNVDALKHMPVEYLGKLLTQIAIDSTTDVCVHLDHGKSFEVVESALEAGYSSVMYDGSQLPLEENIKNTRRVVEMAKKYGATVEGEIGSVGYSDPALNSKARYTDPHEARRFVEETGVDAVAVAIGTLHRMVAQEANIQYDLLNAIEELVSIPLVLHGSTGVKDIDLKKLSESGISKVNIGTALRMAFGNTMRDVLNNNPDEFDRLKVFKESMTEIEKVVENKIRILGGVNVKES
jgi:fructose-bisphosphate aldolase class II